MHREKICIAVGEGHIDGTFAVPRTGVPGILFVHGWSGSQQGDLKRAKVIAELGCVCLTFDLRGHAATEAMRMNVTPRQNLHDLVAAYDALAGHPMVDSSAMAVIGASYGAYLATILTSFRPVRWLSLRVPALYRDEHWALAKGQLDRLDLTAYRNSTVGPDDNRALAACSRFQGDVLTIESEHDDLVPHTTIANYLAAFRQARSLTYRVIEGADHGLSEKEFSEAYSSLLLGWVREMVLGAR
ncbi:pimeloyl-ACP methyl ester carboxylesterase [Ancylobacter sp. 3268]|uniref:alpha/beta hydrolase family protein n=1 Tax=Ancylobacter sp. 3268 TaxID=2817752 RepID=UPI0028586256|nr:alpha/beta fold hydrolase [Ancylobacter sp. 3268]MDR6954631.1 pimeloyl-ACP methyl ester carboxylesterase [Ancylobacter sp. 3268]